MISTPNNPANTQAKSRRATPASSHITISSPRRARAPDLSSIIVNHRPTRLSPT